MDSSAVGSLSRKGRLLSPDSWDPDRYARFAAARRQPFLDLLALLSPIPGGRAVDLGCGTGELTRELHQRTAAAETLGIDSSATMLAKSAPYAGGGVRFEQGDIGTFAPPEPFDLVFSNAALQWVPDHAALLARLTAAVAPDGQLAFQVPDNFDHPSHLAAEHVAAREPFHSALGGAAHPRNVLAPEAYEEILDRIGYAESIVRPQVYADRLETRGDVVTWVEGALLSEYRRRLSPQLYASFVEEYRRELFERIPDERPYFYTYRRILVLARRS